MFRVDPQVLGIDADEFVEALRAEGIPCSAHYIGQCIYDYPLFINHSAFERGSHPFSQIDYTTCKCPDAELALRTAILISSNENFGESELDDCAKAIKRVAEWFVGKKKGQTAEVLCSKV